MGLSAQQITKLAAHVWTDDGYATFALLDGAGTPGLLDRLYGTGGLKFECLYNGEIEPDIAEVAPYIARLEPKSEFAAWVLGGWGESRGILAQAQAGTELPVLRRHFRKLGMVYGSDGSPMLFRYYDPRVLSAYLPSCEASQVSQVFGPVKRYVMERETERAPAGAGVAFSAPAGVLVQESF